jgi:hypothetical protein
MIVDEISQSVLAITGYIGGEAPPLRTGRARRPEGGIDRVVDM